MFLLPVLDGVLIPFQGASFWFLRAPVQTVHQTSDVIAVILDSELVPDQFRNPRSGPKISPVAVHHRSLQKKADQTSSLRPVQLQRSRDAKS